MSDFAEFDAYCDAHPELAPPQAFAQWLADLSGETVVGREIDGDAGQQVGGEAGHLYQPVHSATVSTPALVSVLT